MYAVSSAATTASSRPWPRDCWPVRISTHTRSEKPEQSINFVTCHDGFTLNDLVSYNEKHNEANGERNRDGCNDNRSWNCGVEGPTDDPAIERLRNRQVKNLLALNLLAIGTPMILGGDEVRRTQQGNNNAYCQDNEISWFDWSLVEKHAGLLRFVKLLLACRLDPARDIVGHHGTLTSSSKAPRTLARRRGQPGRLEFPFPESCSNGKGASAGRLSLLDGQRVLGTAAVQTPAGTGECQGPWRRWIDTALESPDDACEWRCGKPVTADQYRVEPRSLVILILPEISTVQTA